MQQGRFYAENERAYASLVFYENRPRRLQGRSLDPQGRF